MSQATETKRGPGRPKVDVDWQEVLRLAKEGRKNIAICEALGISRSHLQKLLTNPERRMQISVARAKGVSDVFGAIYKGAIEGKASMAQMYLRSVGRW
jgi:hypothetical protein